MGALRTNGLGVPPVLLSPSRRTPLGDARDAFEFRAVAPVRSAWWPAATPRRSMPSTRAVSWAAVVYPTAEHDVVVEQSTPCRWLFSVLGVGARPRWSRSFRSTSGPASGNRSRHSPTRPPCTRRSRARHAVEVDAALTGGVRGRHDRPRGPVPLLGQPGSPLACRRPRSCWTTVQETPLKKPPRPGSVSCPRPGRAVRAQRERRVHAGAEIDLTHGHAEREAGARHAAEGRGVGTRLVGAADDRHVVPFHCSIKVRLQFSPSAMHGVGSAAHRQELRRSG